MDQLAADKRSISRPRVLKGGVISFRQLGTTIDCTVRNLSNTGACLMVTSPVGIPDEFDLVLDRDKTKRRCSVVWRRVDRIGVEFQ